MSRILASSGAFPAWLVLTSATLLTLWLADGGGLGANWAVPAVLMVAAFKAWIILRFYMELGHAPRVWRLTFEVWVAVTTSMILGIWVFGAG